MQLFVYTSANNATGRQLMNKISSNIDNAPIEFFNSLESFIQHLRKPISSSLVAILWPQNSTELSTFIKMRHLLRNRRIILILPNRDETTISESHILRPRYVSQADGDLSDVVAVVSKMARMEKPYRVEAV